MQINVKRNMGDRRNRFHLLSVEESDEPDDKTFVKINNTNEHIVVTLQTLFSCMLREKKNNVCVIWLCYIDDIQNVPQFICASSCLVLALVIA